MLIHYRAGHPTPRKAQRRDPPQPKGSPEEKPKVAITMDPMQAAIMEFVGEKLQLAITPALIYGYFCSKKMGLGGNVAKFLQEVINDFYQARGINSYEEVNKQE